MEEEIDGSNFDVWVDSTFIYGEEKRKGRKSKTDGKDLCRRESRADGFPEVGGGGFGELFSSTTACFLGHDADQSFSKPGNFFLYDKPTSPIDLIRPTPASHS